MISKNGSTHAHDRPEPSQQAAGLTMVPISVDGVGSRDKNDEGFKLHPHQLWAAFCRHWFLSVVLGLAAAIPVAYLVWKHVPTPFQAQAQIRILSSRQKIGFELPEDRENFKILKSREIQRVKHPDTIDLALNELADALQKQAEEAHSENLGDKQASRLPAVISNLSFFQNLPEGMSKPLWLRNNLAVTNTGDETFAISLEGESPQELKLIVDSVSKAYFEKLNQELTRKTSQRKQSLDLEIENLRKEIESKQTAIKSLASELEGSNATKQDLTRENELLRMSEIQAEIRQVDRELIDLNGQLQAMETASESKLSETVTDSNEPVADGTGILSDRRKSSTGTLVINSAEDLDRAVKYDTRYLRHISRMKQIEREIKRWKDSFTSADLPEVNALNQELHEAQEEEKALEAALKQEYQKLMGPAANQNLSIARFKINALQKYKAGLEQELEKIQIQSHSRIQSSVDLELERDALEELQQRKQSLESQKNALLIEGGAQERIREDIKAEVPDQRETKKRDMMTAGAGLGTFGFVVALFVLLELRFSRVSSLKLLEDEFEFPILGTIPRLPVKVLQNQQNTRKAAVYKHTFMEAIDSVRTVLLNHQKKHSVKIIMVTSALGGEGKSTLSSHLAISFARAGRKTLLIDGDLRRPRVHEVFQIPDFPGFCETLRGETPVEKCIYPSGIAGLDIMPAGEVDAFTLRMLSETETQETFGRLRDEYDIVLFDSSPLLPVADSLLIMQSIDGVLLSIRKDHSRMSKVAAAIKKIKLVDGRVLGGIVIGINEAEYSPGSSYYADNIISNRVTCAAGTSQA